MDNRPGLIFRIADCFGNLVELRRPTWEEHILPPDRHPQMAGYEDLVRQPLTDPWEVRAGKIARSAVFVSEPNIGPSPQGIRVVVRYEAQTFLDGLTAGIVATAYPIDWGRYSSPQIGVLFRARKTRR